jgi:hypothetical protein
MLMTILFALVLAQQPAATQATPPATPELPILDAKLGTCSADFTVKDAEGKPVYLALINVRVRYGMMSLKRMDLEVGTNSEGKARIAGLPAKAKPLNYEVTKGTARKIVTQDVEAVCAGTHAVDLPAAGS